jgi:hypothetical protein
VLLHETFDREIVAGAGRDGWVERVRFDWSAGSAVAGIAEATIGSARGAQGRQGYAYLDDPGSNNESAERTVFGEDGNLPQHCSVS